MQDFFFQQTGQIVEEHFSTGFDIVVKIQSEIVKFRT